MPCTVAASILGGDSDVNLPTEEVGMRFFAGASLLAIALLSPSPLWAQHWTPQEQEIIDLNQSCWDAWGA